MSIVFPVTSFPESTGIVTSDCVFTEIIYESNMNMNYHLMFQLIQ